MPSSLKIGLVQNTATPDLAASTEGALQMIRAAAAKGAELILLPEYVCGFWSEAGQLAIHKFPEAAHPAVLAFKAEARKLQRHILVGSIGVIGAGGKTFNRSLLIGPDGGVLARYDKIHLFDVDLDAKRVYRESDVIAPGSEAVVAETPWGGLGLSICYDLRFAALYRALAQGGAGMLAVPAAFTRLTGEAHWHILLRARAIENGAFVLAPCQTGDFVGGGQAFGHSLVIDPWGKVLADAGTEVGVVMADLDLSAIETARARIPSLKHDRPFGFTEHRVAV